MKKIIILVVCVYIQPFFAESREIFAMVFPVKKTSFDQVSPVIERATQRVRNIRSVYVGIAQLIAVPEPRRIIITRQPLWQS